MNNLVSYKIFEVTYKVTLYLSIFVKDVFTGREGTFGVSGT